MVVVWCEGVEGGECAHCCVDLYIYWFGYIGVDYFSMIGQYSNGVGFVLYGIGVRFVVVVCLLCFVMCVIWLRLMIFFKRC